MVPATLGERRSGRRLLPSAGLAAAATLFAGCLAGMLLSAFPARAQEQIRGAVDEGATTRDLLRRTPLLERGSTLSPTVKTPATDDTTAAAPYQPATPSAAEAAATPQQIPPMLFGSEPAEPTDLFDDRPLPAAPRSPTERRKAENARAPSRDTDDSATGATPAQRATREGTGSGDDEIADIIGSRTVPIGAVDAELDRVLLGRVLRAEPVETLTRLKDADPYAPAGLRLGTFIVRPSVETGITATSNADFSPGGGSAVLSDTTLRLSAVSNWATNSAAIDAYGNFRKTISGEEVDQTYAGLRGITTIDLGKDLQATAAFSYDLRPEQASSPVVIEDTVSEPTTQTLIGDLGLQKDVGKARFSIGGHVERETYGDADLVSGATLSQHDRDNTLYVLNLRGGYEISPALTPFLAVQIGRRDYDQKFDDSGFQRSANVLGARGGLAFDFGEKLSGEFSAGWLRETPDDERLQPVSGPQIDGSILWSPIRGTTVRLDAATTLEGLTTPDESGAIFYFGRLSVERQMRANLTANLAFGAGYRDYVGVDAHDTIWSAEAGTTYWLNRYAGLVGRLRSERQTSSLPDRDYTANSVYLGLRIQR